MNPLAIVLSSLFLFFIGYVFYAKRLESLWNIDTKRATPAYSKYDSVDYVPAKNWLLLFGHHFASISGAGPIIGTIIAVMLWGWVPTLVWIILGTIFIGGVHDFGSLITSVREEGSSIADIAGRAISKRAKIIFAIFIWLALILVIAVFAFLCADTFIKEPKVVLPSLGLIPVAVLVGFLLYKVKMNTALATVIGLVCLVLLLLLGNLFPIGISNINIWIFVLFIYAYFASTLPVNILLQPRDYLASFLLIFGVVVGYLGLLLAKPTITMPAYVKWSTSSGNLWPMLFVTVACGAVSGFHALIASGTTSKQLANERDAKKIGYGAMLAEGIVAILAMICAGILFKKGDDLSGILKTLSPIGIFGKGYGAVTEGILGNYGTIIAITILNAFILTTLDTATRISRYITEELFKIKKRYFSTLIVVIVGGVLALSGKWNKIWPAFGASNQLVAALALFVVSCWLLSHKKSIKFTIFPAFFMLITTIAALVFQIYRYSFQEDYLLLSISILLIILAGFMVYEVLPLILSRRTERA